MTAAEWRAMDSADERAAMAGRALMGEEGFESWADLDTSWEGLDEVEEGSSGFRGLDTSMVFSSSSGGRPRAMASATPAASFSSLGSNATCAVECRSIVVAVVDRNSSLSSCSLLEFVVVSCSGST